MLGRGQARAVGSCAGSFYGRGILQRLATRDSSPRSRTASAWRAVLSQRRRPVCNLCAPHATGAGRAPGGRRMVRYAPVHFEDCGRRARRVTTAPPCVDHAQPLHSANCARNTTRPGRQGGCRRAGRLRDTTLPRAHPAHPARATAALLQRVAAASHIAPLVWHKHEATRTL